MDKKCVNCRHFRQASVGPTRPEYVWGDCLRAKKHAWGAEGMGSAVSFTWADGGCEQFEPIETS
ncbi:MAG: hypothetical protein ACYSWQ_06865 [Planctomycetota bacterium]|jgi:hypothetical protein